MANHTFYQSNQSNSNDQVMYTTSNRSRSESGSSESSRGSGNSGKPRRRSHRPRGCRGGSNRRRQKNGEGGNKQYFKKTYNSDFKNRVHGKFSQPSVNQTHNTGSSEEEFMMNNKNNGNQNFHRGSYNNDPEKDYNVILPDYPYSKSGMASDLQPLGNNQGQNRQMGQYGNYAQKYGGESENDYPLLQCSFSESSSELSIDHRDPYAHNKNDAGILPPPPSNDLFNRPNQILPGPNPYALNASGSSNMQHAGHHQTCLTHSYAAPTTAPSMTMPVSRPQRTHLVVPAPDMTMYLPGLQQARNVIDFNYRAQRLEKQRQNVVGGSLFVTSPRSFLMGGKRSFRE